MKVRFSGSGIMVWMSCGLKGGLREGLRFVNEVEVEDGLLKGIGGLKEVDGVPGRCSRIDV